MRLPAILALFAAATTATADEARQSFVEANVLGIFYHELGHAVIDLMEVPIFGQEEDAADVASVLLIDQLFDEEAAQAIAYDSAFGYLNDPDGLDEVSYWDVHGPDEQRFFNHVCLFYGGNPDEREDLALDLGLPEERADSCAEEYELAADSWGPVFDDLSNQAEGFTMTFEGDGGFASEILSTEVDALNEDFSFPERVSVSVEACGEANAFYIPSDRAIVFCSEFVTHLEDLFDAFTDG